jgi:hypothetical protein
MGDEVSIELRHVVQCCPFEANARCFSVPEPVSKDWGKHQCVAWEPIMEFMAPRAFDPFQPGLLVHPYFGKSAPV